MAARLRQKTAPAQRSNTPLAAFLSLLGSVQTEVDQKLAEFLDARLAGAQNAGPEVLEMVRALSDLCKRGGKRLRPALVMTGYRAAGGRGSALPLDVGVALELLQSYFLIHDDWMDGDLVRRGGPSVHALLSRRLRDPHKGAASAILAGDYAAALALEVLSTLDVAPRRASALFASFAEMQLAAVTGQQIDLVGRARDIEAGYVLKTGSYTVAGPLKLGAILAGGSRQTLTVLDKVARPLGVGFQLRDDLLSSFGDPKRTGKPLGNDLKSGKRTVLLVEALRRARGAERAALLGVVGNAAAKAPELRRALSVLESSGARAWVEARVSELATEARAGLGSALTREGKTLLDGAISALTERRA
jgi:geranylgeranyl diphosphate synthase type I